jgi:hypothetical protein
VGARLAHGPRGDVRNLTIPSNIDPAKPAQVVPASKADLRANLQAAKTELEHGGFAEGLAPTNYGPPEAPGQSTTRGRSTSPSAQPAVRRPSRSWPTGPRATSDRRTGTCRSG